MGFVFQNITYRIDPHSQSKRQESILICEKRRIGGTHMYTAESFHAALLIPPIPPTDDNFMNIIKVDYFLQVSKK